MKLTEDLLIACGFTKVVIPTATFWVDNFCRIYENQLPATLAELIQMLTGKAFNKGKRKALDPVPAYNSTLPYPYVYPAQECGLKPVSPYNSTALPVYNGPETPADRIQLGWNAPIKPLYPENYLPCQYPAMRPLDRTTQPV